MHLTETPDMQLNSKDNKVKLMKLVDRQKNFKMYEKITTFCRGERKGGDTWGPVHEADMRKPDKKGQIYMVIERYIEKPDIPAPEI